MLKAQKAVERGSPATRAVLLQRRCACGQHTIGGGDCSTCSKEREQPLRRSAVSRESADAHNAAPPIVHEVLRSSGQPLDTPTRAFFEPRFGQDFSRVRVHMDAQSAESARAVNALAYAVGPNVVFAAGQYQPATPSGQKLLAHELAHFVQQQQFAGDARTQGNLRVGAHDDHHELEADRLAEKVLQTNEPSAPARAEFQGPPRMSEIAGLTRDNRAGGVLRRVVNYLRQLPEPEAQRYLAAFDHSVESLERDIQNPNTPLPEDVRQAVTILRSLRTGGRVTCWETSGSLTYASYDNASGQLRLHIRFSQATSPSTLLHEAIHALHAARYPGLSRLYGQTLAAGGTTNQRRGILLMKWKAWTEYWAYRRVVEYDNARQTDPSFRRDAHRIAMAEADVRQSVQAVRNEPGEQSFDPQTWTPPAEYLARPAAGPVGRPRSRQR